MAPSRGHGSEQDRSLTGSGESARSSGDRARSAALLILALVMVLFAALNLKSVSVNWIFGTAKAPLIIVVAISLLVGIVLTHFTERRSRRRG